MPASDSSTGRGRQSAYPAIYIPSTRTRAWESSGFRFALPDILCALEERYALLGKTPPPIGVGDIVWNPAGDPAKFAVKLQGVRGAVNTVVGQVQQAILGLA